jgi:hypothetical protein
MKKLKKLIIEEINHDAQMHIIGGKKNGTPTTSFKDVYSTCNNGSGSDTYEVDYWDGAITQTTFYYN